MKKITLLFSLSFISCFYVLGQWTCGDTLLDTRDAKMYPTVQIGSQCWMAKNLDLGVMLDCNNPNANQTNNAIFEKFCFNNDTLNCDTFGGLYQWDEMMQYSTTAGVQGICPSGWHVPTEAEYITLEGNFPSGTAATALKVGGSSGFEATTGGYCYHNYSNWVFGSMGAYGVLRTSTQSNTSNTYACVRYYYASDPAMYNTCSYKKNNGYTVRCIFNDPATGIHKINENNQIEISDPYPNPVKNSTKIEFKLTKNISEAYLTIYNIMGNEIERFLLSNTFQKITISLSEYSTGTYFYRIQTNAETSVIRKLIVVNN